MISHELFNLFKASTGCVIDSRKVKEGSLFFALKGENTNGNQYASSAVEKGAIAAVIDEAEFEIEGKTILVDDVLSTMQELAKQYRNTLSFPVIALTGSNGKTTTKELIHAVLSEKFKTFATEGNLNNHIGVPLSLLSISDEHEIAVIEMGANHQGEISFLCNLSQPTHGLITNIGLAHLEGFGGPEGVLKGKSELFRYLMLHKGVLFVNTAEEKLKDVYNGYERIESYGVRGDESVNGRLYPGEQFAAVEINGVKIQSNLVGSYNAINIIAAACIGNYFGIDMQQIKHAIENYVPGNNRSEFKKIGENYFILDAYNANPSSMSAAISNFQSLEATYKIAILGDMLELGDYSHEEHKRIAEMAMNAHFNEIIFVGPLFYEIVYERDTIRKFADSTSAAEYFKSKRYHESHILLKGSRGIRLEKITEQLS